MKCKACKVTSPHASSQPIVERKDEDEVDGAVKMERHVFRVDANTRPR